MRIFSKLLLALALLAPSLGLAQNGYYTDRAVGVSQFNGFSGLVPIGYGQVRICTSVDIAVPTSPCPHVASVLDISGSPLSVNGGNFGQVTTDVVGRFNFQASPGAYWIQVAATGSNTPQLNYAITVSPIGLTPGNIISSNNVWTGTNIFKVLNKKRYADAFSAGDYCANIAAAIADLPATGGTVDATGYEGAQPCASNPFSGVTKPVNLLVGTTTVSYTVPWVIAASNIYVYGTSWTQSQLLYTGGASGFAFKVGTATPTVSFIEGFVMKDIYISGNANTTDVLFMTGTHRGALERIELKNATSCGLHTQFDVVTTYTDIHVSAQSGIGAFTTTPACGMDFGQIDANHQTTASAVIDPIVEGVTGSGIKLSGTSGINIVGGTSESNNRGIEVAQGSFNNNVQGIDLEANTVEDILDGSSYNTYHAILSTKLVHFGATSFSNVVSGGEYNSITLDAGAKNHSFDVSYNSGGSGVITDNGIDNKFLRTYNVGAGQAIGIPYTWRDTTSNVTQAGIAAPDRSDFLTGVYTFTTTPTVLSQTAVTAGKPWRVLFIGLWANNFEGGGLPQPAIITELTNASPTIAIGTPTVTVSVNGSNQFQVVTSANTIGFSGRIILIPNNENAAGAASISVRGSIVSGGLIIPGGVNVAGLPAASAANTFAQIGVNDSTAIAAEGQTCVGGSTNKALAISNGTVWKCF